MPAIASVIPGALGQGVVSVDPVEAEDLVPDLIVHGYEVVSIDGAAVTDKPSAVSVILNALGLRHPGGDSLEALRTALRDLPQGRSRRGVALVWSDARRWDQSDSKEWDELQGALRSAAHRLADDGFSFEAVFVAVAADQRAMR